MCVFECYDISHSVTRWLIHQFVLINSRTTASGPVPHLLLPIVENGNGGYSWLNGDPMDKLFWNVTVPVNTGDQFQLGFSDNNRFYVTQLGPRELDADIHVVICEYVLGTECKTHFYIFCVYIFSCDQAALQMVFSVCLSVCLSVRLSVTPFWLCSHHHIIVKFSGVITNDQSKVNAKGQGQRSKVKVTEVTTQLNRFRTVTPVWIHIWWWNDAYSFTLLRRGALLFFKVIRQISR